MHNGTKHAETEYMLTVDNIFQSGLLDFQERGFKGAGQDVHRDQHRHVRGEGAQQEEDHEGKNQCFFVFGRIVTIMVKIDIAKKKQEPIKINFFYTLTNSTRFQKLRKSLPHQII